MLQSKDAPGSVQTTNVPLAIPEETHGHRGELTLTPWQGPNIPYARGS